MPLLAGLLVLGCEPIPKKAEEAANNHAADINQPTASKVTPKASSPADLERRKMQFQQMEQSIQAVAGTKIAGSTPDNDYYFVLPEDWEKSVHAGGTKKESVWLFTSKKTGIKILISCASAKENASFVESAQKVYDSSVKSHRELTKEWKVGNFTLRRSFIGFIDDHHGETTISAFSPTCVLEFNIASETLDRDDLFKFADAAATEFIEKNPKGGFPTK